MSTLNKLREGCKPIRDCTIDLDHFIEGSLDLNDMCSRLESLHAFDTNTSDWVRLFASQNAPKCPVNTEPASVDKIEKTPENGWTLSVEAIFLVLLALLYALFP